jgi:ADP-ribosylglycohydrolase
MDLLERFRGSLVGLAIGDALGHPTEFMSSVAAIRTRWPPSGVTGFEPSGRHPAGTFTDDTQMSICVARALIAAGHAPLDRLMEIMSDEFTTWSRSAQNNRAPGGACMSGCSSLARGVPWRKAGVANSKGCGAAMRAAPVGLYYHLDEGALVRAATAQSAPTHRHPTGYASSVAAAAAVAWATRGGDLEGLIDFTEACVRTLTPELLAEMGCEPELVASPGVREMLTALDAVRAAQHQEAEDVCRLLGGAWIGEEAVATALWCVLRAGGDFKDAVLRGANSSGDSDSIACIAGAIAGALAGFDGVPLEWSQGVEQGVRLDALARALHEAAVGGADRAPGPELSFFTARSVPQVSARTEETDEIEDDDATVGVVDEDDDWHAMGTDEDAAAPAAALSGMRFFFVGPLVRAGDAIARSRVAQLGGSVADQLDMEVTHLVVPEGAAEALVTTMPSGVQMVTESELIGLLGLGQQRLF